MSDSSNIDLNLDDLATDMPVAGTSLAPPMQGLDPDHTSELMKAELESSENHLKALQAEIARLNLEANRTRSVVEMWTAAVKAYTPDIPGPSVPLGPLGEIKTKQKVAD